MLRTILSLLIFTILASACSPFGLSPQGTPRPSDLGKNWTLRMDLSGGIAGLSRSIEISSDGSYTVRDQSTGKTKNGKLSSAELSDLTELLTAVKPASVPDVGQTGCADCFIYTIEFNNGGKTLKAQVDDTTLEDSGLEPLVTFLREIMEKAMK